jgi:hypothetical protein
MDKKLENLNDESLDQVSGGIVLNTVAINPTVDNALHRGNDTPTTSNLLYRGGNNLADKMKFAKQNLQYGEDIKISGGDNGGTMA